MNPPERADVAGVWGALARLVVRMRWGIVGAWVACAAMLLSGLPTFHDDGMSLRGLTPEDAEEIATELDAARLFRVPLNARSQVVRRDPAGLPARVQRDDIDAAVTYTRRVIAAPAGTEDMAAALPITNALGVFPSSRENGTTTIINMIGSPTAGIVARRRQVDWYASQARLRDPVGRVSLTGGFPRSSPPAT